MSHITQLKLSLKDLACVEKAVARMEGAKIVGKARRRLLGKDRDVLELRLPTFTMPVFIDIKTGEVFNDNFGGRWGKLSTYDHFLQLYSSEVAKDFADTNNYSYEEEELPNGHIRCTLTAKEDAVVNYTESGGYDIG